MFMGDRNCFAVKKGEDLLFIVKKFFFVFFAVKTRVSRDIQRRFAQKLLDHFIFFGFEKNRGLSGLGNIPSVPFNGGRSCATILFHEFFFIERRSIFCRMDVPFFEFGKVPWEFWFSLQKWIILWWDVVGSVEGRESGLIIDPKSVGCCIVCAGFGSFVAVSLNIQLFPRSACF